MEYCTGDVYDGQWERDFRHGWGKFTSNETGMTYEGYWREGKKVRLLIILCIDVGSTMLFVSKTVI
ncbi:hypothetical protein EON63_20490 [archaeon]|nr:MAG: hypothetical protein EON63_20490 [archaeon]